MKKTKMLEKMLEKKEKREQEKNDLKSNRHNNEKNETIDTYEAVKSLYIQGLGTREIARRLGIRPSSVHYHIQKARRELGDYTELIIENPKREIAKILNTLTELIDKAQQDLKYTENVRDRVSLLTFIRDTELKRQELLEKFGIDFSLVKEEDVKISTIKFIVEDGRNS